jgi:hypothetical protein
VTPDQEVIALAGFIGTAGLGIIRYLVTKLDKCEAECRSVQASSTDAINKLANILDRQSPSQEKGS